MTKIISFISRKGGTGKTTVAMNLATMLFNLGHKLAMLETDTNYTLNTLRQMEVINRGPKMNLYSKYWAVPIKRLLMTWKN